MVVDLQIDRLVQGGDGLAQLEGMKVFVPYAAPQERVRARIVIRKKDYAVARIQEVIEPSPLRVEPRCPYFGDCGGCQLQHVDYHGQLVVKKLFVNETLQRVGRIYVPVRNITGVIEPWQYRNKTQYPAAANGHVRIGLFRSGSHEIVDVETCLLHAPEFDELRKVALAAMSGVETGYREASHTGNIRHVVLRRATPGNEILVIVVTRTSGLAPAVVEGLAAQPDVVGIVQSLNPDRTNRIMGRSTKVLTGRGELHIGILNRMLRVSAGSFFQVNTAQAEELCRKVLRHLAPEPGDTVVDLYSGVGMLALVMADSVRDVVGIEVDPVAVEDARHNAVAAGAVNAEFVCGDVDEAIDGVERADLVVLDPPRKGCRAHTLERIAALRPRRIVYVSCNPPTLARDLAILEQLGYAAQDVEPVDMFPQTSHVEVITRLERATA